MGKTVSRSHTLDFIYIDANIGESAGGHAAIRLGDTVFHYQFYRDHLFRLVREKWKDFRYVYNDLENRSLYMVRVKIFPETAKKIHDHFTRLYLVQSAHLNILSSLENDMSLITLFLKGKNFISVAGGGFFAKKKDRCRYGEELLKAVVRKYGPNYLKNRMNYLLQKRLTLKMPVRIKVENQLSAENFPVNPPSYSQQYTEISIMRYALCVLAETFCICPAAITDPAGFDKSGECDLSSREQKRLEDFARKLMITVTELAASPRPDAGYPLLLAMARYHVVRLCLDKNRLVLPHVFSPEAEIIEKNVVKKKQKLIRNLKDRAKRVFIAVRRDVFRKDIDEFSYNRLENSGGRYYEFLLGLRYGRDIRVERGRLIPSMTGKIPVTPPEISPNITEHMVKTAKSNLKKYLAGLKKLYGYDLITANCVTELVHNVNKSFEDKKEAKQALGGYMEPDEALIFIPFRMFEQARKKFAFSKTKILPSYRKRMLKKMYAREDMAGVYLREFNTISSTIYKSVEGDTRFLFFTDDILVPRPVYGIFNIVYGAVHAGAGIFTFPTDKGTLISEGLRGILFSLPELFFFNIRKGSYEFVKTPVQNEERERALPLEIFDHRTNP